MRSMISPIRAAVRRFKRICDEVKYADRRLFEIRTGVPVLARDTDSDARALIAQLQALYELDAGDEPALQGTRD